MLLFRACMLGLCEGLILLLRAPRIYISGVSFCFAIINSNAYLIRELGTVICCFRLSPKNNFLVHGTKV